MGGLFYFYSNFNIISCKRTVETLVRSRIWLRLNLGMDCLSLSPKKDAMLIWIKRSALRHHASRKEGLVYLC